MKEILLNRMYVGSFLKDNIGHEVINLFKDDNGSNYIYVNPYGQLGKNHNNIETILLVRGISATTVEIIAKAIDVTPIFSSLPKESAKATQEKYIDENKVKYGGVELYKIYQNNDENKFSDGLLYISYKAGNILYPKNKIYLTTSNRNKLCEGEYFLPEVNFPKQALHWTYTSESSSYKKIKVIVDNESLWEKKNRTKRLCDILQKDLKTDFNFLNLIRKEYDELSYSNMFYHFLSKNRTLFHDFMKDVLGLDPKGNYSIQREVNHIDLLIQDEENIIVIENKIKSGINGVRHDIYGELVQSQLWDYHQYAGKNAHGRKESFFIFAPNYNRLDLRNFEASKYYKVVNYSILYNFFKKNRSNEKYYEDFLSALKMHSKEIDNSNFEIMQERLVNIVKSLNGN